MTDTPPDPQPLTAEEIEAVRPLVGDWFADKALATLDARPSGDEALRAALTEIIAASEGLRWHIGGEHEVPGYRFLDAVLRGKAALAAPVSPSPDVEGLDVERLARYTAMVNVNGAIHFVTDDEGKWVLFSQVAALCTPEEMPHA